MASLDQTKKASENVDSGVPIIRFQNIDRNQFLKKKIQYITPEKARELKWVVYLWFRKNKKGLGHPVESGCQKPEHRRPSHGNCTGRRANFTSANK